MVSQKEGEHCDMLGIFKLIIMYDRKNAAYESRQLKVFLATWRMVTEVKHPA